MRLISFTNESRTDYDTIDKILKPSKTYYNEIINIPYDAIPFTSFVSYEDAIVNQSQRCSSNIVLDLEDFSRKLNIFCRYMIYHDIGKLDPGHIEEMNWLFGLLIHKFQRCDTSTNVQMSKSSTFAVTDENTGTEIIGVAENTKKQSTIVNPNSNNIASNEKIISTVGVDIEPISCADILQSCISGVCLLYYFCELTILPMVQGISIIFEIFRLQCAGAHKLFSDCFNQNYGIVF
eukprot:UN02954